MISLTLLQEKITKYYGLSRLKKQSIRTLSRVDKQLDGKSNNKMLYNPNHNDKVKVGKKSRKLY